MWFFYLPLSSHQRFWFLQRRWLKRFSVCVLLWNERQQQRPVEREDMVFTLVFSFENSLRSQRPVRYHQPIPPIMHTPFSLLLPGLPTWCACLFLLFRGTLTLAAPTLYKWYLNSDSFDQPRFIECLDTQLGIQDLKINTIWSSY